jgi:hypothetical protein
MKTFRSELIELLNKYGKENGANVPDYILGDYICSCLNAFETAVNARETWFGRSFSGFTDETSK